MKIAGRGRRGWLAAYGALLVLGLAVYGSLASGVTGGGGLGLVAASGTSSDAFQPLANALGPAYAFGAGLLAAVNPCGFAMLPGFMALYVREDQAGRPRFARVAAVSATVTGSFVVLFGAIGLLLGLAGALLGRALPVISLLVGVIVVIAGARMLAQRPIYVGGGEHLAGSLSGAVRRPGIVGYLAYGAAYGLTSLSCTLPVFLAVVGTSLTAAGVSASILQFVLYALGMGLVVFIAALAVASLRASALERLRGLSRHQNTLAGLVLMLVGGYVVYYWLTFGNISFGPQP